MAKKLGNTVLNVLLCCSNERFVGPVALIALKGIRVMIRNSIVSTGVVAQRRRGMMEDEEEDEEEESNEEAGSD